MGHDLMDDLETRLRAGRPRAARPDDDAFDPDLLARVSAQPVPRRRGATRTLALPVAAAVTLAATLAIVLVGGPGPVGTPSSAAAIEQTLRWFDPPAGTVLHSRSVETQGGRTTERETWQADGAMRQRVDGEPESSGDAFYDAATNTIYKGMPVKSTVPAELPAGDPVVQKVRHLLQNGLMTVTGPAMHQGVEAWEISLNADAGRPVWKLWVSAADGKPLELRDPGRNGKEPTQVRWETYEVLRGDDAKAQTTLEGAHPTARVVRDPAKVAEALERLGLTKAQPGQAKGRPGPPKR